MPPTIDTPRRILVKTATGWADLVIKGPQGDPGYPTTVGVADESILTVDNPGSPPIWKAPAVGGGVDYIGDWGAGLAYKRGDVVRYQGVDYLAVNPSTGVTPSPALPPTGPGVINVGTSLPASPFDGQEFILVDSLTASTYSWRFRYTPGITDAYKWLFVGGSPAYSFVAAEEYITSTTYVNMATVGPQITVPRAGEYEIEIGANCVPPNVVTANLMSFAIGAAVALDADAVRWWLIDAVNTRTASNGSRRVRKAGIAASTALVAKYRNSTSGTTGWGNRHMAVWPVRVA